jgi:hypothetical protein
LFSLPNPLLKAKAPVSSKLGEKALGAMMAIQAGAVTGTAIGNNLAAPKLKAPLHKDVFQRQQPHPPKT